MVNPAYLRDPRSTPFLSSGLARAVHFERDALVAGRFRIQRLAGQGGMGQIYCAVDLELGGAVALKTLRPELVDDANAIGLLSSEARLARRVTHRNVCRTFDVFQHVDHDPGAASLMLVAMEFLAGPTLAERLTGRGAMAPSEALGVLRQIAAGLEATHAADVLHLDLKSTNVFLVPEPAGRRVVVADFGLSGIADRSASARRALVGERANLAPEVRNGASLSPATDTYSLAVLLRDMLAARGPRQTCSQGGPRPRIPRNWETVIRRATRPDPARRIQSPQRFLEALDEAGDR